MGHFTPYLTNSSVLADEAIGITGAARGIHEAYANTQSAHDGVWAVAEGTIVTTATTATYATSKTAQQIVGQAAYAASCVRTWYNRVVEHDTSKADRPRNVATLNAEYEEADGGKKRELDTEHEELGAWLDGRGHEVAAMLDRGPNRDDILRLWNDGAIPSTDVPAYQPWVDLNRVAPQKLPYDLQHLTPEELKGLGVSIPWRTTTIDLRAKMPIWERVISGKVSAKAQKVKNADGSITITVDSEALVGIDAEVLELFGGGIEALKLNFGNEAEMNKFFTDLQRQFSGDNNLDSAAHALIPAYTAFDVAKFLWDSPAVTAEVGATAQEDIHLGDAPLEGELSESLTATQDVKNRTITAKAELTAGYNAGGMTLEGGGSLELKVDPDGKTGLTISANISRGTEIGEGVTLSDKRQTQATINIENVMAHPELAEAVRAGDVQRILTEAHHVGAVTITQTDKVGEEVSSDDVGTSPGGKKSGVDFSDEVSHEQTAIAWVKKPGSEIYIPVSTETADVPG